MKVDSRGNVLERLFRVMNPIGALHDVDSANQLLKRS